MKHIDNLFKDALYNHEVPVPEGMWEKVAPQAEKSGRRALIWFWILGGILAILIGSMAYYFSQANETSEKENTTFPLAASIDSDHSENVTKKITPSIVEEIQKEEEKLPATTKVKKQDVKVSKQNSQASTSRTATTTNPISTLESSVSNDATFKTEGKPANILITKSYSSDEGLVITQSNLSTEESVDLTTVYDMVLPDNKINAATLLRIVEPITVLDLPGLSKELKKKVTQNHL